MKIADTNQRAVTGLHDFGAGIPRNVSDVGRRQHGPNREPIKNRLQHGADGGSTPKHVGVLAKKRSLEEEVNAEKADCFGRRQAIIYYDERVRRPRSAVDLYRSCVDLEQGGSDLGTYATAHDRSGQPLGFKQKKNCVDCWFSR